MGVRFQWLWGIAAVVDVVVLVCAACNVAMLQCLGRAWVPWMRMKIGKACTWQASGWLSSGRSSRPPMGEAHSPGTGRA